MTKILQVCHPEGAFAAPKGLDHNGSEAHPHGAHLPDLLSKSRAAPGSVAALSMTLVLGVQHD